MKVEIWSDVVCPWCHIGKRRFEAALAAFEHREAVQVVWRSFELDPGAESDAPAQPDGSVQPDGSGGPGRSADGPDYADRLARKYRTSRAGAQQMIDTMTASAAAEGLDFRFDRAVRANTFDAHQVVHLAQEHGRADAVEERLMRAYFTEGEAVGDRSVLARLAGEAGVDPAEVAAALEDQRYAAAVRADEAQAAALGISGVPFFVVDRRYGVSGAQPAAQLLAVLERAWDERRPLTLVGVADGGAASGETCGPDGCCSG